MNGTVLAIGMGLIVLGLAVAVALCRTPPERLRADPTALADESPAARPDSDAMPSGEPDGPDPDRTILGPRADNDGIPATFTIRIAPFLGVPHANIQARLRWRINEGDLRIGYALLRPDHVRRDIISDLIVELRDRVQPLPVFMGLPPSALTATG